MGCNFSCYKQAMIDINGFDEELGNSAYASDTDLEWRFKSWIQYYFCKIYSKPISSFP